MGEATKRLPRDCWKEVKDIPWKRMAGLRDIIVHQYDRIELEDVWLTVTIHVPALVEKLEPIIEELKRMYGEPNKFRFLISVLEKIKESFQCSQ